MRIEKKATLISSSVALVLVTLKLTVGIIGGSVAVLASAIDSLLDLVVSAFNYFALHNSAVVNANRLPQLLRERLLVFRHYSSSMKQFLK